MHVMHDGWCMIREVSVDMCVSTWCECARACLCREAAVIVTSVNIHKGDYGSIIVGGRQQDLREPEESLHRYVCPPKGVREGGVGGGCRRG